MTILILTFFLFRMYLKTTKCGSNSMVEFHLPKVAVASSILVSRSLPF